MLRIPNLSSVRSCITPASSFFNPSYRSLSRPQLDLLTASKDRCLYSSGAKGSNSSSSSSRRTHARSTTNAAKRAGTTANAAGKSSGICSKSSASTSSSSSSSSSGTVTTTKPKLTIKYIKLSDKASGPTSTVVNSSVAKLSHVTPTLVNLDSFFSLERPLLELPIRLDQRQSTTPAGTSTAASRMLEALSNSSIAAPNENDASSEEIVDLDTLEGQELAEVVDLGPDGEPTGSPYFTVVGHRKPIEPLRTVEEEREIELKQEEDLLQQHEATIKAYEEEAELDPYDAWLIGEPEGVEHAPVVARYLASHQPFTPPAPPASTVTLPKGFKETLHAPETLSNLSFLRPFKPSESTFFSSSMSSPQALFASQLADPLSPSAARQQADRFLSSASLTHRWHAQYDFDHVVSKKMEKANRTYEPTKGRKPREQRIWHQEKGWTEMKGVDEVLFLDSELVDLDWSDEKKSTSETDRDIRMDSTRRKRKKKITKHKYKKRRKAQRALRQRLGK